MINRIDSTPGFPRSCGIFATSSRSPTASVSRAPGGGGLTGQVRIGATHTFNIGLIPACVALFLARHPTMQVSVEELAAMVSVDAVPAGMTGLQLIPIESPTPIRTPGILWRLDETQGAAAQSFAVIARKTALGNRLRASGPV